MDCLIGSFSNALHLKDEEDSDMMICEEFENMIICEEFDHKAKENISPAATVAIKDQARQGDEDSEMIMCEELENEAEKISPATAALEDQALQGDHGRQEDKFKPFMGVGRRLDGRPVVTRLEKMSPIVQNGEFNNSENTILEPEKFQPFTGKFYRLCD
ncbi:hypothetical protein TorRG33x02_143920 [Trema orientale]|uniref:Uncharacterized protein n=1 Tax=Trema orientale TaxID=63057 RepID=A0A2P5EWG3_TREOI|nr:hypothetical protein TorRG33x02_143920 [Trema orientale]